MVENAYIYATYNWILRNLLGLEEYVTYIFLTQKGKRNAS